MATAGAAQSAYKENLDNILTCPDCKEYPPNLVEEFSSGDMVCDSCGLVVGPRIIDSRSEWRTFANDDQGNDDPSRVGEASNALSADEGLRTQVDMRATNGKLASKLHSINKKSQSEKLNNDLQDGFRAINALVDMMQTTPIVGQTASHIYKLAYENGQLKGKPREAVIAGCIFIACRQCGVPRTFREIYAITRVSKKEIGRVFKSLEMFLSKIQEKNPTASAAQGVKDYKASSSTSAEELCTRYCSLLGFRNTPRVEKVSKALARKTSGISDLAGRSPLSVAAACIYFASMFLQDARSSKDIAAVAGVSDGTIKTAYRFLYNVKETLVEDDWQGNLDCGSQGAVDGQGVQDAQATAQDGLDGRGGQNDSDGTEDSSRYSPQYSSEYSTSAENSQVDISQGAVLQGAETNDSEVEDSPAKVNLQ